MQKCQKRVSNKLNGNFNKCERLQTILERLKVGNRPHSHLRILWVEHGCNIRREFLKIKIEEITLQHSDWLSPNLIFRIEMLWSTQESHEKMVSNSVSVSMLPGDTSEDAAVNVANQCQDSDNCNIILTFLLEFKDVCHWTKTFLLHA